MNPKIVYVVLIATVFNSACVSAGVVERNLIRNDAIVQDVVPTSESFNVNAAVSRFNEIFKYSVNTLDAAGSKSPDVWENVINYLKVKDIHGLWVYLSSIPEMQVVLDWLEVNHNDVFLGICWIFDSCGIQDTVIDPKIIQKILQLIQRNDWEGLVAYLNTLEDFDLLCDWIKSNFADAWSHICYLIDRPC